MQAEGDIKADLHKSKYHLKQGQKVSHCNPIVQRPYLWHPDCWGNYPWGNYQGVKQWRYNS